MSTLAITTTIRAPYPKHPYEKIKDAILGKSYDLSLVFIGSTRAQTLNETSRGKSYVPNVLSFPLSKTQGEIFICPETAKREAKKFDLTEKQYIAYLFIHGCLHLSGLKHGATMDTKEQYYLKKFNLC